MVATRTFAVEKSFFICFIVYVILRSACIENTELIRKVDSKSFFFVNVFSSISDQMNFWLQMISKIIEVSLTSDYFSTFIPLVPTTDFKMCLPFTRDFVRESRLGDIGLLWWLHTPSISNIFSLENKIFNVPSFLKGWGWIL